jgi:hypothetical protein
MKPEMRFFEGERIILREIPASTLMATLATEKMLVNKSCYIIRIEDGHQAYCYLLGMLNSRAVGFWIANEGDKAKQNLFPRITMAAIKRLPIPTASWNEACKTIAVLVDRILAAKKANPAADISALESEIDALVYQLYGLTEEEIKVVEGKDKVGQEAAVTAAAGPAPSRKRSRAAKQAESDEEEDEVLE